MLLPFFHSIFTSVVTISPPSPFGTRVYVLVQRDKKQSNAFFFLSSGDRNERAGALRVGRCIPAMLRACGKASPLHRRSGTRSLLLQYTPAVRANCAPCGRDAVVTVTWCPITFPPPKCPQSDLPKVPPPYGHPTTAMHEIEYISPI